MAKAKNLLLCILAAILSVGCAESEQYVNLETTGVNSTGTEEDITIPQTTVEGGPQSESSAYEPEAISGYDDSKNNGSKQLTQNSRYIYTYLQRVDIINHSYSTFCSIVGCDHMNGGCEVKLRRSGLRCYENGVYYLHDDQICYRDYMGNISVIYTNTYSNEYTEKNDPETDNPDSGISPTSIYGMIFADEHTLLVNGRNFFFLYDLNTGEATAPIEVYQSGISSYCLLDGKVYSSNDNAEVYSTDLAGTESVRVLEQGRNIQAYDGRLWYSKWTEGICSLYSNNTDFTDETEELYDIWPSFEVCDAGLLYLTPDYEQIKLYTWDGEDKTLVNLQEVEYQGGKEGYEYSKLGFVEYTLIDDTLYFNVLYNGVGYSSYDYENPYVWYSVRDGVMTEFTEE